MYHCLAFPPIAIYSGLFYVKDGVHGLRLLLLLLLLLLFVIFVVFCSCFYIRRAHIEANKYLLAHDLAGKGNPCSHADPSGGELQGNNKSLGNGDNGMYANLQLLYNTLLH